VPCWAGSWPRATVYEGGWRLIRMICVICHAVEQRESMVSARRLPSLPAGDAATVEGFHRPAASLVCRDDAKSADRWLGRELLARETALRRLGRHTTVSLVVSGGYGVRWSRGWVGRQW
jgi:hypothetical protein